MSRDACAISSADRTKEHTMSKEKNKGGKEARKPKKEVAKTIAANPSMKGLMATTKK